MKSLILPLSALFAAFHAHADDGKSWVISTLPSDTKITVTFVTDWPIPVNTNTLSFPESSNKLGCAIYVTPATNRRLFQAGTVKELKLAPATSVAKIDPATQQYTYVAVIPALQVAGASVLQWIMCKPADAAADFNFGSLTTQQIEDAAGGRLKFTATIPPPQVVTE
jgi:hypothetical protein